MKKEKKYWEYEAVSCNFIYQDDKFDMDIVKRILNSDSKFCFEVIVTNPKNGKKTKYWKETIYHEELL